MCCRPIIARMGHSCWSAVQLMVRSAAFLQPTLTDRRTWWMSMSIRRRWGISARRNRSRAPAFPARPPLYLLICSFIYLFTACLFCAALNVSASCDVDDCFAERWVTDLSAGSFGADRWQTKVAWLELENFQRPISVVVFLHFPQNIMSLAFSDVFAAFDLFPLIFFSTSARETSESCVKFSKTYNARFRKVVGTCERG